MPTLTFRGGRPAYIDASGQFHEAKLGANGYVYKNAAGGWTPVGGNASVVGPSGGTPAPVTPAAGGGGAGAEPAAAGPTAPGWRLDPTYLQQLAQNQATETQTIAGLTGQRQRQLQGYGYSGQFDPAGKLTGGLQFDPTDPYSRAALLKRNYDTQRRTTGQGMASRGQLYAGAYQSAQDVVTRNQAIGEDQLQKSLTDYLAGVGTKIGAAGTTRGQADIDAATQAAARAAASAY